MKSFIIGTGIVSMLVGIFLLAKGYEGGSILLILGCFSAIANK
jgi:hypothetical protein